MISVRSFFAFGVVGAWVAHCSAQAVRTVREPHPVEYRVIASPSPLRAAQSTEWLTVQRTDHPRDRLEFGSRLVIGLGDEKLLATLEAVFGVRRSRRVGDGLWILQAQSAAASLDAAAQIAGWPGVTLSRPVHRRRAAALEAYAKVPNDPYFKLQAHLDQRDANGKISGPSLNVRSAWPIATGKGVLIAVADEGVDLSHADLAAHATGPHFNFINGQEDGSPYGFSADHGTAVAGLALARGFNRVGVAGAAPEASLASWVVLGGFGPSDEQYMNMYQYKSNIVSVQNHSWNVPSASQVAQSALESLGVENARLHGRAGRGVVMVRAGGNGRLTGEGESASGDANDDAETCDRRVIAVAAVRQDGQVASYSSRGACLLVAAPGGEGELVNVGKPPHGLVTTDRTGSAGYNSVSMEGGAADGWDYTLNVDDPDKSFYGTSAASPLIAGVVALMLEANPALAVRDVQQILALSARFTFANDPDLSTNGAGLRVSHNIGFGVPDAGDAVRIAQLWTNRPAQTTVTRMNTTRRAVPEVPLMRVEGVSGLTAVAAFPSLGKDQTVGSGAMDLVDLGQALVTDSRNLTGKIALIERGPNFFSEKIGNAAAMGARAVIIFNNSSEAELLNMGLVDDTVIPAVFIAQAPGTALREALAQGQSPKVRLAGIDEENALVTEFVITEQLLCEHVGVYVDGDFPRRGDLRITLVSPSGTVSRMQNLGFDDNPGPSDWTYYSTHHFFEGTPGKWKVLIHDQQPGNTGSIRAVGLTLYGTTIQDSDGDGLDDRWEQEHFHNLSQGPADDPDHDGVSNMREQLLGTDPMKEEVAFELTVGVHEHDSVRLSWPGKAAVPYEVWAAPAAGQPLTKTAEVAGVFPFTEWVSPQGGAAHRIFQIRTAW